MNDRRNVPPAPRRPTDQQRANLFRREPMRRPQVPNTSNSTEGSRSLENAPDVRADSSEILVRDQYGEIEVGDPPTPIFDFGEEDAIIDDGQEVEKERQRLAEAVSSHRISHSAVPEQQEELLEAVRTSLRAKVLALADDNWRFEAEEQTR